MRISIQTLGTRGDVQPYLALALGLMKEGHAVQIAAPVQFEGMAKERGVPFAPLPGEFLALLDSPEGKAAIAGGQGFSAGFKLLKHVRPLMRRLLDEEWNAGRSFAPDAIVFHPKSIAAPHIAERLKIPCVLASPLPGFTPTAAFPSPLLPFRSLGPFNRISHLLGTKGASLLFARIIKEWRANVLGLNGRTSDGPVGTLYAYSTEVVPAPADWGEDVLVSGYWFIDGGEWTPTGSLSAFLESGEPPIYIGFGSMPGIDPQHMASVMIEALTRSGRRGLLATGGGALQTVTASKHVYMLAQAPHDKLFPLISAVIHHGGAGTTGAALRAGKPMTICPFLGDQPFWARRVTELGAGPPALDRRKLSVEAVTAAIDAMTNARMRAKAEILGQRIRQEDGITAAIRFIEARCTSD